MVFQHRNKIFVWESREVGLQYRAGGSEKEVHLERKFTLRRANIDEPLDPGWREHLDHAYDFASVAWERQEASYNPLNPPAASASAVPKRPVASRGADTDVNLDAAVERLATLRHEAADIEALLLSAPKPDQKEYYSVAEAEKILNVGSSTLYDAIKAGRIPSVKTDGYPTRIPASAYVRELEGSPRSYSRLRERGSYR